MLNSKNMFIAVAPDSKAETGIVPMARGEKRTVAMIQHELLTTHPYHFTEDEVLFETHVRHRELPAEEVQRDRKALWKQLFSKPQACLRASPLPKSHGWGVHFDERGRVAIHAVDSPEYARLTSAAKDGPALVAAMRSKRV